MFSTYISTVICFRGIPKNAKRVFYFIHFSFRLANVRGAEVAVFNPLDSKCEESLDMCCRHPDWRDVPLEQEIELPPKIPVECLDTWKTLT